MLTDHGACSNALCAILEPVSLQQVQQLKDHVAKVTGLPVDKLKVVHRGTTLVGSDTRVPLSDGGSSGCKYAASLQSFLTTVLLIVAWYLQTQYWQW